MLIATILCINRLQTTYQCYSLVKKCWWHVPDVCNPLYCLLSFLWSCSSFHVQSACQSGCNCDQPADWKAEQLSLNCLEEVELTDLNGADHEVVFVERLFSWATVLKKIRMTFNYSVSKSKARELLQTLSSFSRSETLVEFYVYRDKNTKSTYLLAPEAEELSLISDSVISFVAS